MTVRGSSFSSRRRPRIAGSDPKRLRHRPSDRIATGAFWISSCSLNDRPSTGCIPNVAGKSDVTIPASATVTAPPEAVSPKLRTIAPATFSSVFV